MSYQSMPLYKQRAKANLSLKDVAALRSEGYSTTAISEKLHVDHGRIMWIIQRLALAIETRTCRYCGSKFVPINPRNFICTKLCKIAGLQKIWNEKAKKYSLEIKLAVQKKLGGKCVNCGIVDHRVLQVNHLNGGGSKEYKSKGSHRIMLEILQGKREGEFDLRCANCNILYSRKEP